MPAEEPMETESLCPICREPDDSNNGEGPCLACQANRAAFEADRALDMARDGEFPPGIARALMQRKKFAPLFQSAKKGRR
jgi:hypothetical protein